MSKLTRALNDIKVLTEKLETLNRRIRTNPNDYNAKAAFGNFEGKLRKAFIIYNSLGTGDISLVTLQHGVSQEKIIVCYVDLEILDVEALVAKEYGAYIILEIKEFKARKPYNPNAIT